MDDLDRLSGFAAAHQFDDLPAAAREHLGWVLADTVASVVAGSAEPELRALAARQAPQGGATLVGLGRATQPATAALINGSAGTFLEMDEGNRYSRGHPAVHVLPAVLALTETQRLDVSTFLSAVVVGYEVGSRIGAASQLRAAMHPHGTWGTVGAAAASARACGMNASEMREAINMGASMTIATSKKTMLEGGLVRNLYAGLSNHNGLLAAQLVQCGFSGERDGVASLCRQIVSERYDPEVLLRDLGQDWHMMHNYFKRHSCCRYNHGTLDAIDRIAEKGALPAPEQVASVCVRTYGLAAELVDPAPRNTLAAKFSVPFAVATRIVHGHSGLESFTWEAVRDPRVLALAAKVEVVEDLSMTRRLPDERPSHVRITATDGRQWMGEVGVNRGDDASPYTSDELGAKFMELCGRVWPLDQARQLLDATLALTTRRADLAGWLGLLGRPPMTLP
jgi:2-methylcitrate dehydratase PrpD